MRQHVHSLSLRYSWYIQWNKLIALKIWGTFISHLFQLDCNNLIKRQMNLYSEWNTLWHANKLHLQNLRILIVFVKEAKLSVLLVIWSRQRTVESCSYMYIFPQKSVEINASYIVKKVVRFFKNRLYWSIIFLE